MKRFFITAIGTDSGKTFISAIVAKAIEGDYWKPVQSGEPSDSEWIRRICQDAIKVHPEQFKLALPASPHHAAAMEGIELCLDDFTLPKSKPLVIEGAGGIMVPINKNDLIIDLAEKWEVPIILVCNFYLGSINHSLLSIQYLKSRNLQVAGIIFNGETTPSSESIIRQYSPWPVLLNVDYEEKIDSQTIERYALKLRENLAIHGFH